MNPPGEPSPIFRHPTGDASVLLNAALESMPQGFSIWDEDLRLVLWNRRYLDIYAMPAEPFHRGLSLAEVCRIAVDSGNHPATTAAELFAIYRKRLLTCTDPAETKVYEKPIRGRTIRSTYQRSLALGWVVIHEDITGQQEQMQALRRQNMRFEAAVDNISQGLCMFDRQQRLIICNKRYADIYGLPPELVAPGTTLQEILDKRIARGVVPADGARAYIQRRLDMVAGGREEVDTVELQDGRIILVRHHPMLDHGWVSTHQDITEQRRTEARIRHLARHDALTDLPNLTQFRERMEAAEANMRAGGVMAVLFIDLDHFKSVNDLFGHGTGDAVLREVAERLRRACREHDIVARLGGDEFAVLCPLARPEDAAALAERIVGSMTEPLEHDRHPVRIGASVGIAFGPKDGADADTLMKNADLALYRAKAAGRGAYLFFEPGMDAAVEERLAFEIALRSALATNQLGLVYQPLLSLGEKRIAGFEALLRWHHTGRGVVMPETIIPIAEESGLIVPIGAWMLREACAAASEWPPHVHVAVNLSPAQFRHGDLVQQIVAALESSGLDPHCLEIEVPESVVLADSDLIVETLGRVRALGVRVAMDDFGGGYSRLGRMHALPVDRIKIDPSFARGMSSRTDSLAVIKAVIGLGRSLGIETTAEGIETEDQLDLVREQGCTEVQGPLFSPPLPPGAIRELFAGAATVMPPSAGRRTAS